MRMETPRSRAHNVGYMGICHGDDPAVTCKRCGILCCYEEELGKRCWVARFGGEDDAMQKMQCPHRGD